MRARRTQPRITDPRTYPREWVCLRVAAEFLGVDERTVRARIEDGRLPAIRDGRVYQIALADLLQYDRVRRETS